MNITIKSIHFVASAQLEAFIQKKVAKLDTYYDGLMDAEVSLKVIKPEEANNKEVGIQIEMPKMDNLFSSKIADTFEEAVDKCVDALIKQLQKAKEKAQNK